MNDFFTAMVSTQDNTAHTENGAVVYKTSRDALVDLNYFSASFRSMDPGEIIDYFEKAYNECNLLAIKWLFFCRDCRGGMGERRTFRILFKWLIENHYKVAETYTTIIPFYGYWDDLFEFLDTDLHDCVIDIIKQQFADDREAAKDPSTYNKISLLAKWMPSLHASAASHEKATIIRKELKMSEKKYRRVLSNLRKIIDVVEVKMSANKWDDIKYEAVPSIANMRYASAFIRHDSTRRASYLEKVLKGEVKINASVTFPHDIIHQMTRIHDQDATFESMWKALPNTCENGISNTLVVCDGSGSMMMNIGGSTVHAMDVSYALSIYFSERINGAFKDRFITFSSRPQLIDLSSANSVRDKLNILRRYSDCSNTNIEAVFNLILQTAIQNHLSQEELPAQLLIVSDGEFDAMVDNASLPIFTELGNRYHKYGYKLPKLVFWNVNNRSMTVPVTENELGVALVSGFSPNISKMIMSEKTDPLAVLIEQLNDKRYHVIDDMWSCLIA